MARAPDERYDKALKLYKKGLKLVEIASQLKLPEGTVRRWKSTHKWENERSELKSERSHKGGAPKGSKNALGNIGGAAPKGNINSVKHGAYQNIYLDALPNEEKELYEKIDPSVKLDNEIKLIRLKISRLISSNTTFFYDMFGNKREIEITEEDRVKGITACLKQLDALIKTKASIENDTAKFEYQKYKDEIELEIKLARLELDKAKSDMGDNTESEDDGFLDALSIEVDNVWED